MALNTVHFRGLTTACTASPPPELWGETLKLLVRLRKRSTARDRRRRRPARQKGEAKKNFCCAWNEKEKAHSGLVREKEKKPLMASPTWMMKAGH